MAKCDCNEPKVKIVKRVANDVQIETRENGFVVKVGKPPTSNNGGLIKISSGFYFTDSATARPPKEVIKYEGPAHGEEYVFGDFTSLSNWLKNNIRHGKPAKA